MRELPNDRPPMPDATAGSAQFTFVGAINRWSVHGGYMEEHFREVAQRYLSPGANPLLRYLMEFALASGENAQEEAALLERLSEDQGRLGVLVHVGFGTGPAKPALLIGLTGCEFDGLPQARFYGASLVMDQDGHLLPLRVIIAPDNVVIRAPEALQYSPDFRRQVAEASRGMEFPHWLMG